MGRVDLRFPGCLPSAFRRPLPALPLILRSEAAPARRPPLLHPPFPGLSAQKATAPLKGTSWERERADGPVWQLWAQGEDQGL